MSTATGLVIATGCLIVAAIELFTKPFDANFCLVYAALSYISLQVADK